MAIEYNFTLDMDRSKRDNNIAYARTGDVDSITINADLVFNGAAYTPTGTNAFFECITPNGCSIRAAAEKTGSTVSVEVPSAAFQAAGVINVAYFRFETGDASNPTYVESTEPFAIVVREGIGDNIDAGDYIEEWRKLVDHLEVVVADVGQKAKQVEIAKAAAEKAKADAETAGTAAANSASEAKSSATAAQQSATAAAKSAASVADKFITSAQATTLEPGSQATASVENQVLAIGVPKGDKGDKGDPGQDGADGTDGVTPFTQAAVTTLEPGVPATVTIEEDTLKLGVPKGDPGDKGEPGDKGDPGEAATVTVGTTTTGEAGTEASVTNGGTTSAAVLNFTIPRGEKGDKGDTGNQGVQGDKGDPGTAATIAVGSVTGLAAGASPTVVNSGTANAAVLDFGIPKGEKGDKGDPGTTPTVVAAEGSDISVSTDEGTVTIDDSALRARISELENQAANVVTGTSTGLVSHGEDAFPQKPREVRIKGKTWVNRWPVIEGTQDGITVSTDETGLVTVTGTATADADVTADVNGWATGKSYTATISANPTGCSAYFEVQKPSGNTSINASTTGATLNVASDATKCVAGVHVASGTTVNASFRVMLVDGTEAPDCFTPPASIASVETGKLVTAGKNLAIISEATVASETGGSAYVDISNELPPGTYIVKASDQTGTVKVCARQVDSNKVTIWGSAVAAGSKITITIPMKIQLYHDPNDGAAYSVDVTNIQLELGSTATSYESPNVTQTSLPEVELRSLPNGTCDELVIKADGNVVLERRTVQVTFDGSDDEGWSQYKLNTSAFTATCVNFFADNPINIGTNQESAAAAVVCRELPVIQGGFGQSMTCVSVSYAVADRLYITAPSTVTDIDSFKQWLTATPITCVVNVTGKPDEPQSPVTLPALPAPTFNQYHDSPVPSDTSTEYVRDINIVIDNLAKQIAGTAATVAINEATR